MSTSAERQSPSIESISSASSAFSFDNNPGITPISPYISVQSTSRGPATNFWSQAELDDWLPESEKIKRTAYPKDEEQLKSVEASQALADAYPMHKRFCFPAENIYFLVQGVLYSVHRYFFERDALSFAGQGLSKQEPMVLANVSTHDFDLFLSILYPTSFGVYPASTVEEWGGILYLADRWSFLSIRALAIAQIAPIASPIDKIVFGRLYGVNEWLTDAYRAVCARFDALSLEEGRRLGVDDVIRINAIRQEFCFVRVSESLSRLFKVDVVSRFGLAIQTGASALAHSLPEGDSTEINSISGVSTAELHGMSVLPVQLPGYDVLLSHQDKESAALKAVGPPEVEQEKQTGGVYDRHANVEDLMTCEQWKECEVRGDAPSLNEQTVQQPVDEAKAAEEVPAQLQQGVLACDSVLSQEKEDWASKEAQAKADAKKTFGNERAALVEQVIKEVKQQLADEANGVSATVTRVAAAQEEAYWVHFIPKEPKVRMRKGEKSKTQIRVETIDKERAWLVDAVKVHLADKANGVPTTGHYGMNRISGPLIDAAAQEQEYWSHLTLEARLAKVQEEWFDQERAELLKQVKQQLTDDAKYVMAAPTAMSVVCD